MNIIIGMRLYNLFNKHKNMAASFASRLSNLREKKNNHTQEQGSSNLKLILSDNSQKSAYQPSSSFSNTRSSFRLLKGRIQKGQSTEKRPQPGSNHNINQMKGLSSTQKLGYPEEEKTELRLTLNDAPAFQQKKTFSDLPKIPIQKRILIAKEPPKEQIKKEEIPEVKKVEQKQQPTQQKIQKKQSQKIINQHEQKPIREQQAQQSLPQQSQNDLILCPQGCGRKFNRKALQKHAKACKLVFMSKRKEFNSEAKRITSKEQANLAKQNKLEEKKKMGMTKGKGFDKTKTGENWKAASEDFRSAIKAIKKEEKEQEGEDENLQDKKLVLIMCEYCEKQFNEVFIEKHTENCPRKKQRDRQRQKKKTGKKQSK